MDRHSLLDGDEMPSGENVNVFDDAFAVDGDADMVADGFRPAHNHDREGDERQDLPSSSTRSISTQHIQTPSTDPSRHSTRKSRSHENPFTSPEDGDAEPLLHRTPSGNFIPLSHRTISSVSSNQFARTNSQRLSAGGPSHPYAMYPQGTIARTASVATASTVRPTGRSTPRSGPQHPYALYPQGVGDDLDDEHDAVQNQVPIGFPGLGQSFQRQRGPDGEEQDIVGFYGHAEQLPPYSRYPDDGPEKVPLLSAPAPPSPTHSHAPVQGTDPSMPLMHDQVRPAQQSMTDLSQLNRQASTSSRETDSLYEGESTRDSDASKKAWKAKTWKEKKKTRVCGIPFWWYLVAATVVAFILVVVSGAIGGFVAGQRKAEQRISNRVTTTGYDASIISSPASTAPLPTGTFALNLGRTLDPQSSCLTIPQQRPAWDCGLAYGNEVAIHVATPHDGPQSGAYLYYVSNRYENGLVYGSQASQMNTTFSPFLWVHDMDDSEAAPALYFKTQYDKLVVLPEDALHLGSSKIKRDSSGRIPGWFEGEIAPASSKPWFCFWNDTLLEGFIYPNKAHQVRPLPSYSASTTPYSTPAWAATMSAAPSQTITTTLTMSSTTAAYTGAASAFPKWLYDKYPKFNMTKYSSPPDDDKDKRDADGDNSTDDPKDKYGLTVYPYRVKLEERRLPGSPLPYCIQYQVLNDGVVNWIPGPESQQIVIQLAEKNPPFKPVMYPNQGGGGQKPRQKRSDSPGSCHCQWRSDASMYD